MKNKSFSLFFRIKTLLFILFLFPLSSRVSASSLDDFVSEVQKRYDANVTLEADFQQIAYINSTRRKETSRGRVYMKKPGKMRWDYHAPEEQNIISNGQILWFYIPEDRQVMQKQLEGDFDPASPNMFLMGTGNLKKSFHIAEEEKNNTEKKRYLSLTPRAPQQNMARLIIGADRESFQVVETRVIDHFGNITTVLLTNLNTKKEREDDFFNFIPPPGVRVLKEK